MKQIVKFSTVDTLLHQTISKTCWCLQSKSFENLEAENFSYRILARFVQDFARQCTIFADFLQILQTITHLLSFLHVMNFFQKYFKILARNTVCVRRSIARFTKYARNLMKLKVSVRILQEKNYCKDLASFIVFTRTC